MIGFALILAILTGLPAPTSVEPGGVDLRRSGANSIEVIGLDADRVAELKALMPDDPRWFSILSLRLDRGPGRPAAEPIVGRHELSGSTLRFTPRYPLKAGTWHLARYRAAVASRTEGDPTIVFGFATATSPAGSPTLVVGVDPAAALLPENLLKVYLRFSGPMSRGEAYARVQILDDQGMPIRRPFLEIAEELWDADQTRLTLLLDPGRIKRGLKPHDEEGPILESGKAYTLVIDKGWHDADGRPLADGFRKAFRAGPRDEVQPEPSRWTLGTRPEVGTRGPMAIEFPEPLDRAMLGRAIRVLVAEKAVEGKVEVVDGDRGWRFVPDANWPTGPMAIWVDTELEDLAGNSVARPFETRGEAGFRPKFAKVPVP